MKISIITPTYNSQKTLQDCIDSIKGQTHRDTEHIIVDGASADGTKKIIEANSHHLAKSISEKDNGIYDAMNKGVSMATGDIIGILNSDDVYENDNVLTEVAEVFANNQDVDIVYGDIFYVDQIDLNKVKRVWKSSSYRDGLFKTGWHPPHPAFFVKREVYQRLGKFRDDMNISADYELMLRFLEKNKVKSKHIPKTFVLMREGGNSNGTLAKIAEGNLQVRKAWKVNNLKTPSFLIIKKLLYKVRQLPYFHCNISK